MQVRGVWATLTGRNNAVCLLTLTEITGGAPLLALFEKWPAEPPTPFHSTLRGRRSELHFDGARVVTGLCPVQAGQSPASTHALALKWRKPRCLKRPDSDRLTYRIDSSISEIQSGRLSTSRGLGPSAAPTMPSRSMRSMRWAARP